MAWAAAEAPGSRSTFYLLQDLDEKKGNDNLAPLTSDCNYLRCGYGYYSQLFDHGTYIHNRMSFLPKGSFYVSIKFLASLMGIEHLPQVGESDFIYTGKVIKDAHPDYPKPVPIRDKMGLLINCKPRPKNLENFLDIWLEAWKGRDLMKPQPRLFRARYSDPIISKIVAIKILDDGKQRFDKLVSLNGLRTVTAEGVFKSLIDAYNQNGNCILTLWDDEWPKDKENYVLVCASMTSCRHC